ncbi:MAG: 4-hydroxy-tetrahydrodipicolinate synthase [Bacteroidaceae bacterium]
MENVFRGLGIALITPFLPNGDVDYSSLGELVEYQIDGGIDFLCVLGTTAETPCLSKEEKEAVKKFVIKKVAKRVPILLGCGGNNTAELVKQLKEDDLTDVDGILSVCPYYNKPSQEGLYQHFKAVAEATTLPVMLYNVPGRTGINLSATTTVRLANDCENIVAIKEASGNISQIEDILKKKPNNFDVLSGDDSITYEIMTMGGVGVISVIGNAYPTEFGKMVKSILSGNFNTALPLHRNFNEMFKLLSVDGNPAGIKSLLAAMGKIENKVRLPLVPARKETQEKIKAILA